MAAKNYDEIRQLIIDTLAGRPVGTMIYPEGHQEIDLQLLDFAKAISETISTGLSGEAQANTQPIQPANANVAYVFQVAPNTTKTFSYFRDSEGTAISVTTNSTQLAFGFLIWNKSYWTPMTVMLSVSTPAFDDLGNNIIQLLDGTTPVYPRTKAEAVFFDDDTDKTLDEELSRLGQNIALLSCSTAAGIAAKTVSATGFDLMAGGSFKIKFTYANTAESPTLNINSTGAKAIVYNGIEVDATHSWSAGEVVKFYYDPSYNGNSGGFIGSSTIVSVSQNTLTIGGEDKGELAGQLIENSEWLTLYTDKYGKIAYGCRKNGDFHWGKGVPSQIIHYIEERLKGLNISEFESIVAFLNGLEDGGSTLDVLLSTKVNVEEGKSLIDSDVADGLSYKDNEEFVYVKYDANKKLIEAVTHDRKIIYVPIETQGAIHSVGENPEWANVYFDRFKKIVWGIRKNGDFYFGEGVPSQIKDFVNSLVEWKLQDKENIKLLSLPDYYFANDYLDNKIRLINEKIRECSNNGDIFFWITDIHWEINENRRFSPSLINYIRQRTNIPRLFNGGDNYDGLWSHIDHPTWTFDGNIDLTNRLRKAMNSNKVYTTYGNHEVITYNTYPQIFYALRQHNDDVVYGDADKSYFYVDNNQQKIRYIILTAFGVPVPGKDYYDLRYLNEFKENPAQLDWLMGTALNMGSDWTAVIFIHGIFYISSRSTGSTYAPKLNDFQSRKLAYGEPWAYENIWLDAITHYSNDKIGKVLDYDPRPLDGQGNIDLSLAPIITPVSPSSIPAEADKFMLYSPNNNNTYIRYVARIQWYESTWRLVWTEYGTYESESALNIGDEVTIWKGFKGKIAGVLQGHTHADRMHIEGGIPFIITSCDKWTDANDLTISRVPGTITEQHFEVAILNKNLQKWTLISIGAPANDGFDDNIGNEVQVREVEYE